MKKSFIKKSHRLKSKKSIIEIQFNWIFIMIVGAIILIFFISIVIQQSKVSSQKLAASVSLDIGSIFSGAQVSTNTEHIVEIPPFDIFMVCDNETGYSSYRIKTSETALGDSLITFAPEYIIGSGRELLTWSLDWNAPYRVTNFLYLTSPVMKFIVINGSLIGQEKYVYDNLPDKSNKGQSFYSDLSLVDNTNNYKVKIIKLYDSNILTPETYSFPVPSELDYMDVSDLNLIYFVPSDVSSQGALTASGIVYFYKKNGSVFSYYGKSMYIGEAGFFGAIFSDSLESYNCNMEKAFKRWKILNNVYHQKAQSLVDYFSTHSDPQNCQAKISDADTILMQIASLPKFSEASVSTVSDMITNLKNQNKMIQRYSCPVIY